MGARNATTPSLDFSFHPQGEILADADEIGSPKPMPLSPCIHPFASSAFPLTTCQGEVELVVEYSAIAARQADNVAVKGEAPCLASRQAKINRSDSLEKGFSQLEWMKRMQHEPGLAGLKDQSSTRSISLSEVKQHRTEDDAWTVLGGRVYNVTPYLRFHPGGRDMLMKGAGKDCTALFSVLRM